MFSTELSISTLLSNLIGLFLLIGAGFLAVRLGWLPRSASEVFTALLMRITLPATVFCSMLRPFTAAFLRDALIIMALTLAAHLSYTALALGLSRGFRVAPGRRGMWSLCCAFCNNGFMGFPVAYALFGEEGLALAIMLGIPFNLLVYTIGAKLVCLDPSGDSARTEMPWRKILLSPVNIATVVGIVFFCLQIPVAEAVRTPIQHLSNVTTPLSMFVTGMNLSDSRLGAVVRDRDVLTASATRLLLFPLLTWALVSRLPVENPLVLSVFLVIMAMPSPAVSVILGEQYGGCVQLAARTVFLSSLLCIVTLPLIALLL